MTWEKPSWSLWLVISLLAAWSFSGGQEGKKTPAFSFVLTFPLKERALFPLAGRPGPNLLYNQNRVYAYTEAGQIVCYDLREKKITWTSRLQHPILAAPVLADNNLLVVDQGNNLACFSPEGNLLWEKKLPEPYEGKQMIWDDKLVLASAENRVVAFNVSSGEMIWRVEVDSPVSSLELISDTSLIVLSSQGKIYLFSSNGDQNLVGSVGQEILSFAFSSKDRLVLATADRSVVCWDLKRKRPAWKLRLGGQVAADPLVVKKRLYVAAANAVLYCLNLKSGEIQWWKPLPSPLIFGLLACGEAILVATVNPPLVGFDARRGQELGRWEVEGEICSPVFFVDNFLALATFDPIAGEGFWRFLEPEVEVSVVSSVPSPIKPGDEVRFTAVASGFVRPRFEFSLLSGKEEKVVQQEKERATWTWVPHEPGDYTIVVRVRDERRRAEASISFQVIQEVP